MSEVGNWVCCACELGYHDLCERGHMTNGACLCCMENSLTLIEKEERIMSNRSAKTILKEIRDHGESIDILVDELFEVLGLDDDRDVKSDGAEDEEINTPKIEPFDLEELKKILEPMDRQTYPPFIPTYPNYPPFNPSDPNPIWIGTPPYFGDYTITCSFSGVDNS
jgi:hypothetical protein